MSNRQFRTVLASRQREAKTILCVGLDPLLEKLPPNLRAYLRNDESNAGELVFMWMKDIVDATAPFVCMFKPQRAHWEAITGGIEAMRRIVAYIHEKYPGIVVFLDCKRGDIDRTQQQYRHAHFKGDGVDGMNFNGWMGADTLKDLFDPEYPGRALVGLGRTSNPRAWEVQDLMLHDGRYNWEMMVDSIMAWAKEFGVIENAGVVMGAAHKSLTDEKKIYSLHLSVCRERVNSRLWMLIPGIGTQGGAVEQTVVAAFAGPGSMVVNSSSGIIFAKDPAAEAAKTRDALRAAGGNC